MMRHTGGIACGAISTKIQLGFLRGLVGRRDAQDADLLAIGAYDTNFAAVISPLIRGSFS